MNKTVCLTGGSGGIGQTLVKHLLEQFHVKALFRKECALTEEWKRQGCEIILGDLKDEKSLIDLVTGTEFVFHCAALIQASSLKEANEVNVDGTRQLAHAAAISGCKRFIHLSTVAVYSGSTIEEKIYTEEVEVNEYPAMEVYCLTKLRSEIALKEVARQHRLEYVILRPTCVYGPTVKSYTMAPLNIIQKGLPLILGDGEGLLDVVYVDDVARAMILAAHSPKANRETFNLGGEQITCKEFYSYYGRMTQRPVRQIPRWMMNIGVSLARINPELGKTLKWYIDIQNSSAEYPSTKAKTLLGYSPQFSLSIGMLKTQLWLQSNHYIPAKSQVFRNPLSLYTFNSSVTVHPTTEEEIVQVIEVAAQEELKVRAVGSLHSFTPIQATEDVCIVLDKYKNLVKIEGFLVTVQAGMKLCELNEILAKHNLALPILGAIADQTVSGAIATGTHGGSLYCQSLSSYVHALRIIRADGSIMQVERSQDLFNGIVISMGLLGITSTITFKCIPAFYLQSSKLLMPISDVIQRFDEINQKNKYVDMRYNPILDSVEVLLTDSAEGSARENEGWAPVGKTKMSRWLLTFSLKLSLRLLQLFRWNWLQRSVMKQYEGATHACPSGRSDFVLTHLEHMNYDLFPINNMEIAIPYSQASAAITALRNYFNKTQKYPNVYIQIRCSAEDSFWLSPAYEQAVCWLNFWQYPALGKFFEEMIEVLKPFKFRCHWGKHNTTNQEYIKQQYKKWTDFVQLRQEWDPKRMFSNPCLDAFFLQTCKK